MFDNKSLENASVLADQVAQSADHTIKSTHRVANEALDSLHDASRQLHHRAQHASDSTAAYIRHEPVKSVLIGAAAGAVLMALLGMASRSRGRG